MRNSAATDERIKRFQEKVDTLESQQKAKVAETITIKRFKESLEQLKEQAKKKFMEEQEKIEQKQLDETATMSFARENQQQDKEEECFDDMNSKAYLQENRK